MAIIILLIVNMNTIIKDTIYKLAKSRDIVPKLKSFKIPLMESPTKSENRVDKLSYILENLFDLPKKLIPTIIYVNKIGINPVKCLTILGKEYLITSVLILNSD
jgi:hypothetical protein